jgi:serine/threonine protein kinase
MKVLDKCRIEKQNIYKYVFTERNIMVSINNPFIVKLYYSFQSNEKLFLILEYCPNGDLSKQLKLQKRFSEEKAKFYICEIILALGELHKNDIIYRDLKPDNIVIDKDGHVLLTDFGLSREGVYDKNIAKSFCGSIAYLAPEMLNRRGHGKAVDWYLLGVIFYEMLVGVPPFFTPNQEEIFRNIIQNEVYIPSFVSKKAQKLIKLLLKKNPEQRLGAKKDMDELKENEYFSDIDWDKVYNKKCKPPQIISDKQKLEYFKEPILFLEDYDSIIEDENDLFIKDSCNIEDNDKNIEQFSNDIPFNKYEGWSLVENPISS